MKEKIVMVIVLVKHLQMIVSSVLVEILDLKKIMLMIVMKIVLVKLLLTIAEYAQKATQDMKQIVIYLILSLIHI